MENQYRQLDVYKKAEELILLVYKVTKGFPKVELFGLVSQMRRAAVSALANFVEGYGRKGVGEKIQFCFMSVGSLNELELYIDISYKLGYLDKEEHLRLSELHNDTIKLIQGYIRGIRNKN
jgi:four helix bundle protein